MEVHSASIDNIKSPYILRKLLSLLCETKKLDLLMYNKRLQNKMKINIENYKNIIYKYKIKILKLNHINYFLDSAALN